MAIQYGHRVRVLALAATVSLSVIALSGFSPAKDAPSRASSRAPKRIAAMPIWNEQQALHPVVDQLRKIGNTDPYFTGTYIHPSAKSITVYRSGHTDKDQESKYAAVVPDKVHLKFAPALLSKRQVDELSSIVVNEFDHQYAVGVDLTSWGQADGMDGPYVVSYKGSSPGRDFRSKLSKFGGDTVVFRKGE